MLAVTVVTIVGSVFAYVAARKRYHADRRIADRPRGVYAASARRLLRQAYTGQRRPVTRPRGRYAIALLSPVVIIAAAGSIYAGYLVPGSHSGAAGATPLTVRYRTESSATAAAGKMWLEVVNSSARSVALQDVKLRYYFSADSSSYGANCFQSALRCSNVTPTIGATSGTAPGADHHLLVGFTSGAGSLAPGQSTQGIGLQLYRRDHRALDQTNDRSFDAKATHYAPSRSVTAYVGGALKWGDEPGADDSARITATPVVAAPPAGVMFDNFHYTGPADPALAANGWKARTEGGGPGIRNSWSADGISFPADPTAVGGQVLRLRAGTDGTRRGTRQAELRSTGDVFSTGTLAARIHFTDRPVTGRNGDHINEAFCVISSSPSSPKYSELDFEYQPNGGWGVPGPKLDTTSWRSVRNGDRATRAVVGPLQGWHIVMLTVVDGVVTYSIDGRKVFSSDGATYPRESMRIQFSAWLVDLPCTGKRSWDMRVDWIYSRADQAMSMTDVVDAVGKLYAGGINNAGIASRR